MRSDVAAYAYKDIERAALVELWDTATPAEILDGSATGEFDLSPYAASIKQTESSLALELRYNTELAECSTQPKPGQLITVKTDTIMRFLGIISAISGYTEERGTRVLRITARLRDGFGGWKTAHASTEVYPQGTLYSYMLENICGLVMGLDPVEYDFPAISYSVPHTNSQFADETPWSMLDNILMAANMTPYVNVINQVSAYDKSIVRGSTLQVASDRVVKLHGSSQTVQTAKVRLRWLSTELSRSSQQDQLLYSTAMTAGFFDLSQEENTWFSDDHTQRAENTYMIIKDSVNSGLLPVADEAYEQKDTYHGEITLDTHWWVPTLATASIAAMIAASSEPDGVITDPVSGIGETVPIGRPLETLANVAILLVMMSMGVGRYEIWGEPFDYVKAKNTTLAYAENVPDWAASEVEIDNDLIMNEEHAQSIATTHLVWLGAGGYSFGATIVDDPRIELGDIIAFDDGSRLLVQGFSNDYSRGSAATMEVKGFRV